MICKRYSGRRPECQQPLSFFAMNCENLGVEWQGRGSMTGAKKLVHDEHILPKPATGEHPELLSLCWKWKESASLLSAGDLPSREVKKQELAQVSDISSTNKGITLLEIRPPLNKGQTTIPNRRYSQTPPQMHMHLHTEWLGTLILPN